MRFAAFVALALSIAIPHAAKAGDPPLVTAARRDLGRGNFTGQRGPWCAFAVSAWLKAIGLPPLPGGTAGSALRYGPHVAPRPGVLAVSWKHVAVVERVDGPWLITLNGNWGGRVRRARVPAARLVFVEVGA
jgi:hypothetical protein